MTYVERHAEHLNQTMFRDDIEWAVSANGQLYLRDKQSWSAQHTREIEYQREQDRDNWKRAQWRAAQSTPTQEKC